MKLYRGSYSGTHPVTGAPIQCVRATNIAKQGDDGGGLANWKVGRALVGVGQRPDLLAVAQAMDPDGRVDYGFIEQCIEAGQGSKGANYGTALHELYRRIADGQTVQPPEGLRGQVDAFAAFAARAEMRTMLSEVILLNTKLDPPVAGTVDRVAGFRGRALPMIADFKTTKPTSVRYAVQGWAVQLAIYANADWFWTAPPDGGPPQWWSMPALDTEIGVVIHVPVHLEGVDPYCRAIRLDLGVGWTLAKLYHQVYHTRNAEVLL